MSTAYFSKVTVRLPVRLSSGAKIKFEPIDSNLGILATSDPEVIAGLSALIGSGSGGISLLSKEEYDALLKKKLTPENRSERLSNIIGLQTSGIITLPSEQIPTLTQTLSNPAVPAAPADNRIVAPLATPPTIKLGAKPKE